MNRKRKLNEEELEKEMEEILHHWSSDEEEEDGSESEYEVREDSNEKETDHEGSLLVKKSGCILMLCFIVDSDSDLSVDVHENFKWVHDGNFLPNDYGFDNSTSGISSNFLLDEQAGEVDYFKIFFDHILVSEIVIETNRYVNTKKNVEEWYKNVF